MHQHSQITKLREIRWAARRIEIADIIQVAVERKRGARESGGSETRQIDWIPVPAIPAIKILLLLVAVSCNRLRAGIGLYKELRI